MLVRTLYSRRPPTGSWVDVMLHVSWREGWSFAPLPSPFAQHTRTEHEIGVRWLLWGVSVWWNRW